MGGWLSFNNDETDENYLTLIGTPEDEHTVPLQLQIRVTDANGQVSDPVSLLIDVENIDQPLVVLEGNPALSVNEGEALPLTLENLDLSVTDPDTPESAIEFTVKDASGGVIQIRNIGEPDVTEPSIFTLADLKNPDLVIQYQHTNDEPSGEEFILLSVTDGETVVDIDQFDITINPINDNDPMAQDHDYTGNHREQLVVSLFNEGLLSDATDADLPAEELTAQVVTEPAKGNLNLNADGTFTYTPPTDEPAGQLYEDSFTYKVLNGDRESLVATVELTIQALPGPSIDMGVTAELSNLVATELDVFTKKIPDSLFDGVEPFVWHVSLAGEGVPGEALSGWLEFNDDATSADYLTLSGTPQDVDANSGPLELQVAVTDANGQVSTPFLFSIEIENINQPLELTQGTPELRVNEGQALPLSLTNLDLVVTDPDTPDSQIEFTAVATGGVMVLGDVEQVEGSEAVTFTLADLKVNEFVQFQHSGDEPSDEAPAFIELSISDGGTVIDIEQIDITVDPINDNDPMAQDHDYTGNHREQLIVSTFEDGLLSDVTDTDLPAEELIAQVVTEPEKGNLNLNDDGTFTYTPPTDEPAGQLYEDSFTYKVLNGDRESLVATVDLMIQALPGPGINMGVAAELNDLTATELDEFTKLIPETLFNGVEPFEWDVSFRGDTVPGEGLSGWLSFNNDAGEDDYLTLSGRPQDEDANLGPLELQVSVTDANGQISDPFYFSINVENINQRLVVTQGTPELRVNEGEALPLSLTNLDLVVTDPDTPDSQIEFTAVATGGVMVLGDVEQVEGSVPVTFTLAELKVNEFVQFQHSGDEPSDEAPAFIELSVSDGATVIDIDQIDITVDPVNDNDPIAQNHDYTGKHREELVVSLFDEGLLSDVTDADLPTEELTAQVVIEPEKGNLNINDNGTFTYTPPADEPAGQLYEDSFTYKVLNGDRESLDATVNLMIEALPGPSINMAAAAELNDLIATELDLFTIKLPELLFDGVEPLVWAVSLQGKATVCKVTVCKVTVCKVTVCKVTVCKVTVCKVTVCKVTVRKVTVSQVRRYLVGGWLLIILRVTIIT